MGKADLTAKIRLEGDSSGANRAIKKTEGSFKKLGKSLRTGALAITASLASVAGAVKLIEAAGQRLGQKRALERLLKAQGISVDEYVGKLKSLANNQIATSDIILSANRALALGISATDIPGLLEAATKASVSLGVTASKAFQDITTGVGRASPLILDNLGIMIDQNRVFKDYAESIGVATNQLTKQQRTAAVAAAAIAGAAKGAEDFATAQSKVTVALDQSRAKLKEWFEQTVNSVAKNEALATSIFEASDAISDFASGIAALHEAQQQQKEADKSWIQRLQNTKLFLDINTAGLSFAVRGLREFGDVQKLIAASEQEAIENIKKLTARRKEQADAIHGVADATTGLTQIQIDSAARTARIIALVEKEASAMDKLAAALGRTTQIELQKQLAELEEALATAREEAGATTNGFQRLAVLEEEAAIQTEKLEARILSISLGLGDIDQAADDAGDSIDGFGDNADSAGGSVDGLGDSLDGTATSAGELDAGMRSATQGIAAAGAQAVTTAAQFDALAKSAGEAAAVAAGVAGGGQITQGGTRIRFAGGGSRLTNTSGRSQVSSYGLSEFGTGGRYKVDADGNLEPP